MPILRKLFDSEDENVKVRALVVSFVQKKIPVTDIIEHMK